MKPVDWATTPFGRFNPTRVRLKQVADDVAAVGFVGFNPTRVRLKPSSAFSRDTGRSLQSHEGSSETVSLLWRVYVADRFNPTRVRLKHDRRDSRRVGPRGFNPTRVRLKQVAEPLRWVIRSLQSHEGSSETREQLRQQSPKQCFNPTRVRLKPGEARSARSLMSLQSHEGSSETRRPCPGGGS